ncbi:dihydrolipoamide dehydrogenase [Murinocardiopsis flavida]|uniref:NAD(P)H dehydrogenase (quinone) n=1 Tax=Murinocardiopsis flavida TaxID=645275 RepID=A0A2P8DIH8_9ACTN|nr:NAD(P)H-quinone dehydrogenase [Murinocardiopsis flavida]PSK97022.1 dihydrolipoamide dehydrogenase [Murinocardiopsis flavida]
MTKVVIIGGGPGGYEPALVAAQLGADVTVVEREGIGGACVLTDCVPSKTLIATSTRMTYVTDAAKLGIRVGDEPEVDKDIVDIDLHMVNQRVNRLADKQSEDTAARLVSEGVEIIEGEARLVDPHIVAVGDRRLRADVVLVATGAHPRELPSAVPDGERILTWRQLYDLPALPERLIVVGSGVTGAEFANAYQALGSQVTLVSSRDKVLPTQDQDAAGVLEDVFRRRGMTVLSNSRAESVTRVGDGVRVELADGRTVEGSHCLMTVGMIPNTAGLGLSEIGVNLDNAGFIQVDRVSRTSAGGVYAAGDCTGVNMLASVAAMQGRIAMWHALGEAVSPLKLSTVSSTVFTNPELAAVGCSEADVRSGKVDARVVKLPLNTNPRAKMHGTKEGFVKLICRQHTGIVLGGVIVGPRASELMLAVSLAVQQRLTVDEIAHTFAVYPSLSGSVTEAARSLMQASPE